MNVFRKFKYKKFHYYTKNGKKITSDRNIKYLNSIKIPATYTDVLMTTNKKAKVIGTGRDKTGKRQYFYNKSWVIHTSKEKYCSLIQFGKNLPNIMKYVDNILQRGYTESKIYYICVIVKILMICNFRIGNSNNTNDGITDISLKNVIIKRKMVVISFIGKKGQLNKCNITNAKLVKSLRYLHKNYCDINYFFSFRDDCGRITKITNIHVNNFLKTFGPFTAKMFRTWNANIFYLQYIKNNYKLTNLQELSKLAITHTCSLLHNTEAICKKNYLIPELINDVVNENIIVLKLIKSMRYYSSTTENILLRYLKFLYIENN